jgi:hypothetical protein
MARDQLIAELVLGKTEKNEGRVSFAAIESWVLVWRSGQIAAVVVSLNGCVFLAQKIAV